MVFMVFIVFSALFYKSVWLDGQDSPENQKNYENRCFYNTLSIPRPNKNENHYFYNGFAPRVYLAASSTIWTSPQSILKTMKTIVFTIFLISLIRQSMKTIVFTMVLHSEFTM